MSSDSHATTIAKCPLCGQEHRRGGTELGEAITCEGCGEEFYAAPLDAAASAKPNLPPDAKQCTECGETFPVAAARCRYCGGKLTPINLAVRKAAQANPEAEAPARPRPPDPPSRRAAAPLPPPARTEPEHDSARPASRRVVPPSSRPDQPEPEDKSELSELQKAILAADRRLAADGPARPAPKKSSTPKPAIREQEPDSESRKLVPLVVLIVLLVIGVIGYLVYHARKAKRANPPELKKINRQSTRNAQDGLESRREALVIDAGNGAIPFSLL